MSAHPYRASASLERVLEAQNMTHFVSDARDTAFFGKWLPAVEPDFESYKNIPINYLREIHAELYVYGPNNDLVKVNARRIYNILRGDSEKRVKFVEQFLDILAPNIMFKGDPKRIGRISISELDVDALKSQGRYIFPFAFRVSELFEETYNFHLLGENFFSTSLQPAYKSFGDKERFMLAFNTYVRLLLVHDYLSTLDCLKTQFVLLHNLALDWGLLTLK
jgi:hypothetical protein